MRTEAIDVVLVLVMLGHLVLLGSSRLRVCIRAVGVEGLLLGLLPLLLGGEHAGVRAAALAVGSIGLRGLVYPWLLLRAQRTANVRREVEPFVGFSLSLGAGLALLAAAIWLGARLPIPAAAGTPLLVPMGLATMGVGAFLIVTRRKALTQVVGYLVLENGIFLLGLTLLDVVPLLVELGVALDAFVAVLVLSIATHRISQTFDHIDVDQLILLRD